MRFKVSVVAFILLLVAANSTALAQREVALRMWTEVKGTTPGDAMGWAVTAIPPNPNLPYRAAVDRAGRTYFYRLSDSTDTLARYSVRGDDLIVGDINGDGFIDGIVLVTTLGLDTVLIYPGLSGGGLDTLHPIAFGAGGLGSQLRPACVNDVNNDGKPDLVLVDDYLPDGRGRLYFFLGPVTGSTPDKVIIGDTTDTRLGIGGVAVADVNGDGLNDLIVRGAFGRLIDSNFVRVYWGASNSLPLSDRVEFHAINRDVLSMACFDANGDGIADVLYNDKDIVDNYYHVYVRLGGPAFPNAGTLKLANPGGVALYGNTIVNAGDMNGDGYADIAVGAFEADPANGVVFIYGGGPKIDGSYDAYFDLPYDADFGRSIAALGDVNGDGLADILVGAPKWFFGNYKGYWSVVLGDTAMTVTGVKGTAASNKEPTSFAILRNYPNPFNPETTIRYRLSEQASVTVEVFNLLGERVGLLIDHVLQGQGDHDVVFKAAPSLGSGIYYSRLSCTTRTGETRREVRAMTMLK
jgi:hypothetical protein